MSSLLESGVASLLVEQGEGLLFVVVESVLLTVAHAVQEFGVFAPGNVPVVVEVGNSENLLDGRLASSEVSLLGKEGSDVAVVSLIDTIEVAVFQLSEAPELLSEPVATEDDEVEYEP